MMINCWKAKTLLWCRESTLFSGSWLQSSRDKSFYSNLCLDLPLQESRDQIYWLNKRDANLNIPTFCLCRDASSLQLSQTLNRKHRSFPNWTTMRIADFSCITCSCYSISALRKSSSMTKSELMRKVSLSLSTRSWISSLTSLKLKLSNFPHNVIKKISEYS